MTGKQHSIDVDSAYYYSVRLDSDYIRITLYERQEVWYVVQEAMTGDQCDSVDVIKESKGNPMDERQCHSLNG